MMERFGQSLADIVIRRDEVLNYRAEAGSPRFEIESIRGLSGKLLVFGSLSIFVAVVLWLSFDSWVGVALCAAWLLWELIQEWMYPLSIYVNAEPDQNQIEITVQRLFGQQVRRIRLDTFHHLEVFADYSQPPESAGLFRFVLRSKYEQVPISLFIVLDQKEQIDLEQDLRKRLSLKKPE